GRREAGSGKGEAGSDSNGRESSRAGRRVKWALIGLGVLLILISPLWAPLLMRRMAFFRVRRVEILGAHYVAASDILTRLHVDTLVSIWDPTNPLAARIAAHPEIESVVVGRKLPGTLVVQVTERVPVALVPASAGFRVYDDRGRALGIDPTRVTVDVPVLSQRDTALLRLLGEMRTQMPALYARLSEVRFASRNEMVLQLKSGPVRAMQNVTLARLAEIDPVEEDLARRQVRVAEIDLRFRDQVIARTQ
ncbi:MAG TPA: FtsQ-type POTRA domain-containing protein, partial [Gemmatimonadaceae bacterium]